MPVPAGDTGLLELAGDLSPTPTLDPDLLHRRDPAEVFLTDARALGADRFAAAAVLPAAHPYYTSLTGHHGHGADLVLLLECCRQAETYAAHAFHRVDRGASFLLRRWSAELRVDTGRAAAPPGSDRLLMTAVTRDPQVRRGAVAGLTYDFALWLAGDRIGEVGMGVGYVSPAAHAVLRSRGRGGPPPTSEDPPARPPGDPVAPAAVGRERAEDTLLLGAASAAGTVTAGLRVPVDNPSFFEHPHDHVPGMVLVEAARQAAVLAVRGRTGPGRAARLVALESAFHAYAELDAPITMTAVPAGRAGDGPATAERHAVEVTFHQGGADIARTRVVTALGPKAAP